MLKTMVSSARNGGFIFKKQRFLKMILVFANIKNIYYADYQHCLYNAKNKRFSLSKDNASANTVCFCSQDSLFVDFIHIYRMGVIYPKNGQ